MPRSSTETSEEGYPRVYAFLKTSSQLPAAGDFPPLIRLH
ncbi:MAG: hypothetical protein QOC74_4641 [Pseudonocardiales bacterium]|nr:hypothetical protein [Pseudonocardiales bacterium]